MALDVSLVGAAAAGALSFVSPCVLPLTPAYLGFISGAATPEQIERERLKVFALALAFVGGFSTVFIVLGATASTLGQLVASYTQPLTIAAGAMLVLFGLHFMEIVRIPLLYRQASVGMERRPTGPLGAYAVGLAFGFGWTPCVGPILAAILMVAGSEQTAWRGAALLAAYSVGIGLPFLLAALFMGAFLRWSRALRSRLGLIEKASGALLILTGLAFIGGWVPIAAGWLLETFPGLAEIG
ncbi:cytochrome C biogenesis protein CcdA [Methylopila jiangsuensis]|jgi:cytochrome c-type biogenesis protein|uniref:Cytochrome C biogenesis protein CcdA n=1 Tax=Methylopila jiangsuensis TaxID=586230 RepID=A0A9W6N3Q1_9HYPH|nr:cytochrome c biogenesis protein CcdA [Methylopila jiangsuensis]MDR6287042.1 cytochrome c-type biogenesis protein [Methylopila jiangsuensis]GLK76528.1 cytochrome C biogenesis protein CcdA [Methylopila jiangsuensis]